MFLENSRYYSVRKDAAPARDGRTVTVVTLRRPPAVAGTPVMIKENDQLDIMAQRLYTDPTRFWRIADANTELQARDLTAEQGRDINVPKQ